RKSLRLFPRVFFRFLSGLSEPRQPLCKFIAAGWSQPALLHFEISFDRRWGEGGLRQPLAFLRTVKALADFFAEVLEHGATGLSATRRLPCYPKVFRVCVRYATYRQLFSSNEDGRRDPCFRFKRTKKNPAEAGHRGVEPSQLWFGGAFRAAPCVAIPSPSLASGLDQNAICCAAAGAHEGHKARAAREWSDFGHARHRAPAPIANSQRHHVHFLPLETGPSWLMLVNGLSAISFQFPCSSCKSVHPNGHGKLLRRSPRAKPTGREATCRTFASASVIAITKRSIAS